MSSVSSVIILADFEADDVDDVPEPIQFINERVSSLLYKGNELFRRVDQHAGGSKGMPHEVYLAAVNYLDVDELKEAVHQATWRHPEGVKVLVRREDAEYSEDWEVVS